VLIGFIYSIADKADFIEYYHYYKYRKEYIMEKRDKVKPKIFRSKYFRKWLRRTKNIMFKMRTKWVLAYHRKNILVILYGLCVRIFCFFLSLIIIFLGKRLKSIKSMLASNGVLLIFFANYYFMLVKNYLNIILGDKIG